MNALTKNTKITVSDINTLISECNGKLNLSGGTITGTLYVKNIMNAGTEAVRVTGGTDVTPVTGAMLTLFHKNHENSGLFRIFSTDGTNTKTLEGKPDGTLSWNGNFNVTHTSSPNITINNTSGGESSIIIDRGTRSGWKFQNPNGNLIIQNNWTDTRGDWFNVLTINYNTGNATFKGTVKAEQYLFNNGSKLWIA